MQVKVGEWARVRDPRFVKRSTASAVPAFPKGATASAASAGHLQPCPEGMGRIVHSPKEASDETLLRRAAQKLILPERGIRTVTRPGSAQSLDRDPHNHSTGIRTKHLSWIHTTSHSHRAGSKLGPSSGSSFRIQDALCIHSVRAESRQSPDPGGIQAGSGRDPGGIRAGSRRDPGAIRAGSGRNPGGIREGSEWDPGMIRVGPGRDPGGIQEGSGRDLEEIWA